MTPLPCPFCGSAPRVGRHTHTDETGEVFGYAYVECPETALHFAGAHDDDLNEAIRLWNVRTAA